MIEQGYKLIV